MEILEIKTAKKLEQCFPILRELRTDLSFQDFTRLYEEAKRRDDYKLVGVYDTDRCVAVMGYRILFDFVHGKHLYIDDLVVTATQRSGGLGAKLLTFAEKEAQELGCQGLRLCTGIHAKDPQRFYERNQWNARAIAYKKRLLTI